MQHECNDVAFEELILSTRLNINMKMILQSPKSKMSSKRATLELIDVANGLHQKTAILEILNPTRLVMCQIKPNENRDKPHLQDAKTA